ncbi:MAG TPA: hypothetical protein QF480_02250, partial [Bacteroidales bacterium]|nr:hypothetical protein [Bacteroidales bacterium]
QIAYIISNDDAHDVMNTNHVGRRFTMINSPTLNREIIVSNLKKGAAYGMDFFRIGDEPFEDKIERSLHIPKLTSAILYTDTLVVKVNAKALQFRFIGNDGKVLKIENNTNTSSYIIDGKDRYVRTEIIFPDSSIMYLNPIIRYSGEFPLTFKTAEVDSSATMKLRIVYFLIVLSIAYLISRFRMRKKRN